MKLTIDKLYGEITVLMTYCATEDVEYLSSTECANRFKNILETIKEYKTIEQELGIDLITLFNTHINGFYVKGETEKQYIDFENPLNSIAFKNGEMFYGHKWSYQYVKLKDYGKTWALTKEELL